MSCAETDPDSIACNFCEDTFESKGYLMSNKKRTHTVKVEICWNFSSGTCPYGEQKCWFSPSKERINSRLSKINCNNMHESIRIVTPQKNEAWKKCPTL